MEVRIRLSPLWRIVWPIKDNKSCVWGGSPGLSKKFYEENDTCKRHITLGGLGWRKNMTWHEHHACRHGVTFNEEKQRHDLLFRLSFVPSWRHEDHVIPGSVCTCPKTLNKSHASSISFIWHCIIMTGFMYSTTQATFFLFCAFFSFFFSFVVNWISHIMR